MPPAPEPPVTLDVPGKAPDFLRTTELKPAERAALDPGGGGDRTTRPGLHPARQRRPHRAPRTPGPLPTLDEAQGAPTVPAQRKARREYENRVNAFPAEA